jgi:hypothetical protein
MHSIKVLNEVDWTSQPNVTKVSRTFLVRLATGWAYLPVLNDSKSRIKDAAWNGLVSLVVLVGYDIDYALLKDFLRAPDAELDADDLVTHACVLLSLDSKRFIFLRTSLELRTSIHSGKKSSSSRTGIVETSPFAANSSAVNIS